MIKFQLLSMASSVCLVSIQDISLPKLIGRHSSISYIILYVAMEIVHVVKELTKEPGLVLLMLVNTSA